MKNLITIIALSLSFNAYAVTDKEFKKFKELQNKEQWELLNLYSQNLIRKEDTTIEEKTAILTLSSANRLNLAKKDLERALKLANKTGIDTDIKLINENIKIIDKAIIDIKESYKKVK